MQLTIGMACHNDFTGVYMTVQHLREMDEERLADCELVVIDNNPDGPEAHRLRGLIGNVRGDFRQARYVPFPKPGTAAPRQHLFDVAEGHYVLCMDSHVLLQRGALQALLDYYDAHPWTDDLLSGPIVWDDRVHVATHFTDVIRHGMWGVWGRDPRGDRQAPEYTGDPFEIGAQGLGLFSCRRAAWRGFHPHFSGFGGEEWYIHEKFRQGGAKCLSLPKLRWIHRFNESTSYQKTKSQKIANYILGFRELGRPLDRIHRHFVAGENEDGTPWPSASYRAANVITPAQWDILTAGEIPDWERAEAQPHTPTGGCGSCAADQAQSLDDLYLTAANTPSDINEHCETLRSYAARADHVTEFGTRHGVSTVALLAGRPRHLVSYDLVKYPEVRAFAKLAADTAYQFVQGDSTRVDIEPTDLLFVDTRHTAAHLQEELERSGEKVRNWIILHDTVIFGATGEDGGPGLLVAVRKFVRAHPEWTVIRHDLNNHGLMILSRRAEDKQPVPGLARQILNFSASTAQFVAEGMPRTDEAEFQRRLDICALCPLQNHFRCSQCGCPIEKKAVRKNETCPHPLGSQWASP